MLKRQFRIVKETWGNGFTVLHIYCPAEADSLWQMSASSLKGEDMATSKKWNGFMHGLAEEKWSGAELWI